MSPDQAPVIRRWLGAVLSVAGGVVLAVQGRINGQLGNRLHDGVLAALISFGGGFVVLLVGVRCVPRAWAGLARLRAELRGGSIRWDQCVGGLSGAFLVTTQGVTITTIGVAVFTVAVVGGQVASGLFVDRAGLGPGAPVPITPTRAAGSALALVAVVVAVSGKFAQPAALWPAVLPAIAGVALAWQLAVNGRVRTAAGNVSVPTLVNFGVGTAFLAFAATVDVLVRDRPAAGPTSWWMYVGGLLGIGVIMSTVVAVRLVGVLLLGLCSVAGQLIGAVLLDAFVPAEGDHLGVPTIVGTAITLVAVGVAALPGRRGGFERMKP